jgi:transposase InsO family protein
MSGVRCTPSRASFKVHCRVPHPNVASLATLEWGFLPSPEPAPSNASSAASRVARVRRFRISGLVHIQPGKPTQNAHVESFHGRLREECLNISWFQNLFDARRKIAAAQAAGFYTDEREARDPNAVPCPSRSPSRLKPEMEMKKFVVSLL